MVGLITIDVGDTLGPFSDPRVANILFDLSRIPNSDGCKSWIVGEAERGFLHTTPELTGEVVDDICCALIIDRSMWPDPWPSGGFNPFSYTNDVLAELRRIAPVVALTNISMLERQRIRDLAQKCGEFLTETVTSYEAGKRKPDRRLWLDIAYRHLVSPHRLVHIGDRWTNDVCGAVSAGARAIYLSGTRMHQQPAPGEETWPASPDRIKVVDDLRQVPAVIQQWADDDLPPGAG